MSSPAHHPSVRWLGQAVPRRLRGPLSGAVEGLNATTSCLRVLPSFLIVGAQRAGTNSLFEYLAAGGVGRPFPHQEVHFFDTAFDRGMGWYRGHFPSRAWAERSARKTGAPPAVGESSPYYLFHPLAPARIAATLPTVKLIVLLRDPVERAFSHYRHERGHGAEPLPFSEAIDREPERLAGEAERIIAENGYRSFAHQHHSYVARGMYADQLANLHASFHPSKVLVVLSEELFTDPAVVHARATSFLGIAHIALPTYPRYNGGPSGQLDPDIRERLARCFAEPNARLEEMLGRSLPWTRP